MSNRDGRIMGRSDSPLTEEGKRSSEALARTLRSERIGLILSSPLGRAAGTAKIYADALDLPVRTVEAMAELGCGEWEGELRGTVLEPGGLIRDDWRSRPPGGESCADGEERVRPFVRELRSFRNRKSNGGEIHGLGEGVRRSTAMPRTGRMGSASPRRDSKGETHLPLRASPIGDRRELLLRPRTGMKSNRTTEAILVVGHASVNRVFLKVMLDLTPEAALKIICPHDLIYLLGSDGSIRRRSAAGEESEGLLMEDP